MMMKNSETGPAAKRKEKPKKGKLKPGEKALKMDAPGPQQLSSVTDSPSGISREITQEQRKPITNQDEQDVITNQDENSLDAEKN